VEARVKISVPIGKVLIRLNGAYTWVSSTVKEGATPTDASIGKQLIYVPMHQAKANISVHVGKLYMLYGHNYIGLRYTTSDNESSLPAYQLGYLSLGYTHTFGRHSLGLNFTVDNVLNTEYQTIAWRPMPGRSFLINLNYQFL
jgi:iron complex outermembrane receptor protein